MVRINALLLVAFVAFENCGQIPPLKGCGAENYKELVGQSAIEYAKVLPEAELWVKENSHYIGYAEDVPEAVSRKSVMIELDQKEVHNHEDLVGAHIKRIYCLGVEDEAEFDAKEDAQE